MSLFAGVVAVMYDSSKGAPKELNFDNARFNSMSENILGSTVLFEAQKCEGELGVNYNGNRCPQTKLPPVTAIITAQVERVLSNAVTGDLTNTTYYRTAMQAAPQIGTCLSSDFLCRADIFLSFASSSSVVNTQIVSLSVLTTVSIILSTAGTLWGSQEKIKDGIVLAMSKVHEFLHRKKVSDSAQS
jgi:hypothetical protein